MFIPGTLSGLICFDIAKKAIIRSAFNLILQNAAYYHIASFAGGVQYSFPEKDAERFEQYTRQDMPSGEELMRLIQLARAAQQEV